MNEKKLLLIFPPELRISIDLFKNSFKHSSSLFTSILKAIKVLVEEFSLPPPGDEALTKSESSLHENISFLSCTYISDLQFYNDFFLHHNLLKFLITCSLSMS